VFWVPSAVKGRLDSVAGNGEEGERHDHQSRTDAPSLSVDGLRCDFTATVELFTGGLFRPAREAPAVLTTSGVRVPRSFAAA
jgi:hypothetical protein